MGTPWNAGAATGGGPWSRRSLVAPAAPTIPGHPGETGDVDGQGRAAGGNRRQRIHSLSLATDLRGPHRRRNRPGTADTPRR